MVTVTDFCPAMLCETFAYYMRMMILPKGNSFELAANKVKLFGSPAHRILAISINE
jgi:hypothetical protein